MADRIEEVSRELYEKLMNGAYSETAAIDEIERTVRAAVDEILEGERKKLAAVLAYAKRLQDGGVINGATLVTFRRLADQRDSQPQCVGYAGNCDGDLVGLPHEPHCPVYVTADTQRESEG